MTEHTREKTQSRRLGRACGIAGTICIVFVIVLYSLLVFPEAVGVHTYNVISGSMEPAIHIGDLIYVKNGRAEEAEAEDVIAFYSGLQEGSIITHRVVSNNVVSGTLITKGDANAGEDPEPVPYDCYIGKVSLTIPAMGKLLVIMTSFYGKIAAACLIALGAVLSFAGSRIGTRRQQEEEEPDEQRKEPHTP